MLLIGKQAPEFVANAVFVDQVKEIKLSDYKGKYVFLFFYPLDFTFVCPTELHAFQEKLAEFTKRDVIVLGCSVDSEFSHLAWLKTDKKEAGIKGVEYGIISDLGGEIARAYDVLSEEKVAYRACFLIDQDQIIRHQLVNDLPIGRSIDEALRTIDALQFSQKHGQVCPANWNASKKAIDPTFESTKDYLGNN